MELNDIILALKEDYNLCKQLEKKGLSIQTELIDEISKLEKQYVAQIVIPAIEAYAFDLLKDISGQVFLQIVKAENGDVKVENVSTPSYRVVTEQAFQKDSTKKEKRNIHTRTTGKITRSKSIGFRVDFPDGTTFNENKAVDTFKQALTKIGLPRIAEDKHGIIHSGVNLVCKEQSSNPKIAQEQQNVYGWYVFTHMSNVDKVADLQTLSKYYRAGLTITWNEVFPISNKNADNKGIRDTTKFRFNGGEPLSKTKLAFSIVRQYVEDHPSISYSELVDLFPDTIMSKRLGVVRSIEELPSNMSESEKHKRYMMKEEELILLEDAIVVVCSQWRENIHDMIEIGKRLGYTIEEV